MVLKQIASVNHLNSDTYTISKKLTLAQLPNSEQTISKMEAILARNPFFPLSSDYPKWVKKQENRKKQEKLNNRKADRRAKHKQRSERKTKANVPLVIEVTEVPEWPQLEEKTFERPPLLRQKGYRNIPSDDEMPSGDPVLVRQQGYYKTSLNNQGYDIPKVEERTLPPPLMRMSAIFPTDWADVSDDDDE